MVERGRRQTVAIAIAALTAIAPSLVPTVAHAGPREDEAVAVYDRGANAYDRGDFATAAVDFARADELAPNGTVLELALAAVAKTDDAVLAMTLAERAEARKPTKALDAGAHAARRKYGSKVGKLNVVCPPPAACTATLDAQPFVTGATSFVLVGTHRVVIARESATEEHPVVIEAGKTVQLVATIAPTLAAPLPPPAPAAATTRPPQGAPDRAPQRRAERPAEGGISPGWFWFGTAVTVVLGGASILSGLDTVQKHDAFLADRSNAAGSQAGLAADRRTTILLVATGVAAGATAGVGLFLVRWSDGAAVSAKVSGTDVLVRAVF